MLRQLAALLLAFCYATASAQYKNDNVLFTTVDPADLCATLQKNKGYLLLDVRSSGEYHDTSASGTYNLGRLKGAKNIDIRELGKRIGEIREYKDKPVFVYCSHSQRSRRAGKMLADSGFTKVFNVNGGMTALYYTDAAKSPCLESMITSNNPYKIISAAQLCAMMAKQNGPVVIDVRPDSAFQRISLNPKENAYGIITGAKHIALANINKNLSSIPKGRDIVLTDIYGDGAANAANELAKAGYQNLYVLVEGVDRLLFTDAQNFPCKEILYKSPVSYKLINVTELGRMADREPDVVLLDVRANDEFANKSKDAWRNIGKLRGAINIPSAEIASRLPELNSFKDKKVVIYSFGSSPDVFATANSLQQAGFKDIYVVIGGLFNLLDGCQYKGQ
jgi:rhodanese-related sulfurtransferase